MAFPVPRTGLLQIGVPYREGRANLGNAGAAFQWKFFTSGSNFATPADVYQDAALTTPFAPQGVVTADGNGFFAKIYLKPATVYGARLVNAAAVTVRQYDPYQGSLANTGTSATVGGTGLNVSAFNEYSITTVAGGSTFALTLTAGQPAGIPLRISAQNPGSVALIVNNSVITGAQTATFAATNKPGAGQVTVLLTVAPPTGGGYTGGTLTVAWPYATMSATATVTLSTGQVIAGCTLTNGSTTFTTPSTTITGTPNTAVSVSTGIGPVAWMPITCDGSIYYTPLWRGDDFIPPNTNAGGALGEAILATTFTLNGDGSTSVTGAGASATPASWFLPNATGIGAGYFIQITKTGGIAGLNAFYSATATAAPSGGAYVGGNLTTNWLGTTASTYTLQLSTGQVIPNCTFTNGAVAFSCASTAINATPTTALLVGPSSAVWNNITAAGLLVQENASSTYNATYSISSALSGTPVVATGTIQLQGGNGAQSQNMFNGFELFNTDGTITEQGGTAPTNWFLPTTTNAGANFFINMSLTSGATPGGIALNTWVAMSPAVNVYPISSSALLSYNISTVASSAGIVAAGNITIGLANGVPQPQNYSGSTSIVFNTNGTTTGGGGSNWYSPTTNSIGASYWLMVNNITGTGTLTGITSGVWTAMSPAITLGNSGTSSVSGNWQISTASGGTPIVAGGTFTINGSFTPVLHTYTSGTNATETAPTGATQVVIEATGGSGGGGGGSSGVGGGGASGGYSKTTHAITSGQTLTYTVGAAAGFKGTGGSSSVSSGTLAITTMTANGGTGGADGNAGSGGAEGSGGTASGGTDTNTTGNGDGVTVTTVGRPGITGVHQTGNSGGNGNNGGGTVGKNGIVTFYYT